MPRCVVALIVCFLVADAVLAEQRTPPYKAYVSKDDVYVRSGPGRNYYPSGKLQTGDQVEVYRHDPGGWYAVRPPEGSFAWVSARFLKVDEGGLGEVTGDRVAARVGSQFSDIRDVIQVRLNRGELVEVLGQEEFKSASNSGIWYKISPPSGGFRWIHGKYVDPDYLTSGVRTSRSGGSPLLAEAKTEAVSDKPRLLRTVTEPEELSPAELVASEEKAGQLVASEAESKMAAVRPSAPIGRVPASAGEESLDDQSEVRTADHWSTTTANSRVTTAQATEATREARTPRAPGDVVEVQASLTHRSEYIPELNGSDSSHAESTVAKSFQDELHELEMELSIMLAEEPTVWNFDETQLGAQLLLAKAETALERGRARALMGKIERATDIKQRYDAVNAAAVKTERHNRQLAQLSNSRADARAKLTGRTPDGADARFDGMGRLARVVTPKVGAPAYALIDEDGEVTCYVTPAPGVNLHYYLGRQIGITGIRGLLADRGIRHVTAKHVVEMSKVR